MEQGADILDVGGVKAGPGPDVTEAEELDRVVAPIAALHQRFDVAISCDTWRPAVLDAACRAGAASATTSAASVIPSTSVSRRSTALRSSRRTSGCDHALPTPIRTTTISSPT